MADHLIERAPTRGALQINEPDAVSLLLARMHEGDREAAAQFIACFGQRIRRRVRCRLRPDVRRLFDSQEVISTVARRLDLLVHSGKLTAATENQLWALVFTIAQNAVVDRHRLFDRVRSAEESDELACARGRRLEDVERERADNSLAELDRAFSALKDRTDREILSLWLQDTPHLITARLVGLTPAAVRKRWEVIKRRLYPILAQE